jgi:hypothetical protein
MKASYYTLGTASVKNPESADLLGRPAGTRPAAQVASGWPLVSEVNSSLAQLVTACLRTHIVCAAVFAPLVLEHTKRSMHSVSILPLSLPGPFCKKRR